MNVENNCVKMRIKIFVIFSVFVLLFTNAVTYVMLLSKNEDWKTLLIEKKMYGSDASVAAAALAEHVYYDGDSISCNQIVRHYNRFGKTLKSDNLSKILHGDKVLMLLSPNSCSACAKTEIEKMLELSKKIGRNHLVIVADYALHSHKEMAMCFDKEGYYETDVEHLGLEGSPTRETPVVMLVQNGRVKTSFPVGQQTSEFADEFHEYLAEYFKTKK